MNSKIETLDLRMLPPYERHEKIFQTWNSLGIRTDDEDYQ